VILNVERPGLLGKTVCRLIRSFPFFLIFDPPPGCSPSAPLPRRHNPDPDAPKGAVTVLTAAKSCFSNIVEVSGLVLAREKTAVRPERQG
jgi:hypothetical protein